MKRNCKRIVSIMLCSILLIIGGCNSINNDKTEYQEPQGTENKRNEQEDQAEQTRFDDWCLKQFQETMSKSGTTNLHYALDKPEKYGIKEEKEDISFGEISLAAREEDQKENEVCQKELDGFQYDALTKEQQLTYDVVAFSLKRAKEGEDFALYGNALSPDLGIPANSPVELAEYPLRSAENVSTYLELLTKLPEYFKELTTYEQEVAKAGLFISDDSLEDSLQQMKDFSSTKENNYLITTFAERLDEIEGLSTEVKKEYSKTNKDAVLRYVIPAYEQLIKDMSALKGSGTNDGGLCNYPDGKKYYEYLVHNATCSELSVNEVYRIVTKRIETQMKRMATLIKKDASVVDDYTNLKYSMTDPKEILTYLQKESSKYFPDCPSVNYEVKYVDASLAESLSPAFYMIPQMDNYKNNTIYINNKNSNYDANNLFSTLAHEGFPGHLLQTTYFDSKNQSPIRQMLNWGGYSEGWATYVEMCSYELYDFGEKDADITDLCQMESEIALALSTMADIGVNYMGWSKKKLKEYLTKYGMGNTDVVDQVYTLVVEDPSNYLQYYVSYLEFWNLRCKAKDLLGKQFKIKEFHTMLLDCGPCPFPVLEKQVDAYIKEQQK